jgi:hypothetical protein
MKFISFILLLWVISALLDPDWDSKYGSGTLILNTGFSTFNPGVSESPVLEQAAQSPAVSTQLTLHTSLLLGNGNFFLS